MIDMPPATHAFHESLDDALVVTQALLKKAVHAQAAALPHGQHVQSKLDELCATAAALRAAILAAAATPEQLPPPAQQALKPPTAVELTAKRFDALQPTTPFAQDEVWSSSSTSTTSTANNNNTNTQASQPSVWSGFYNKTLRERLDVLSLMFPRLQRSLKLENADESSSSAPTTATPDKTSTHATTAADMVAKLGELPVRTANHMIENCIGVLGIPLGLGLNFVVDGKHLSVPMAVEEPSVVAAASSAAKLVASFGGGFVTATTGNIMTSQVQLVDTPDIPQAIAAIAKNRERLLHIANTTLCPNMKKRGGGAVDIYCRVVTQSAREQLTTKAKSYDTYWYETCDDELEIQASSRDVEYLVVHIDVDVCEAMGANIVNTVAEGLSTEICQLTRSRCGLRILTNLCMQRRARSTFEIPVQKLGWKGVDGDHVASRIVEAYNFAAVDPYRAVTNNKGIMNGVDAVALATGQDWRAIEAAAHCYASRSGQYASLSKYEIVERADNTKVLRGSLELPIAVGSKGGALQTHPGYRATHSILGQPSARSLSGILVSVGLAQNFAAIRAIAVTGIQKGHMALHARNIAVAAGAHSELVSEVCTYMLGRKSINVETAKEYLHAHEVFSEIHSTTGTPPLSPQQSKYLNQNQNQPSLLQPEPLPSMFYVEIPVPHLEDTISLNIAFESINKHPQYIAIQPLTGNKEASELPLIQRQLLGDKGYNQLEKMFLFLSSMRSIVSAEATKTTESSTSESDAESALSPIVTRTNLALQNKLQLLSVLINILVYRLLEVRAHAAGAFMRDVLTSGSSLSDLHVARCRALLADVPPSDDVLSTGLPLFLALCQVLQYHLEQDVANALIRERMATEQWALLRAVVQSFELVGAESDSDSDTTQLSLEAFMAIHAKRWQATMLLLVDSLALATELVTPARLDALRAIGEYMEWEGTIAHDIARYSRALTERVPNALVYWLHAQGHAQGEQQSALVTSDVVDTFRRVALAAAQRKWQAMEHEAAANETWRVFSLPAVTRVARLVRDVYAERSGSRPRKDSF